MAEANVTLSNIFGALELKVGRQFYGDENSTVMYYGPTHYKNVPSTITPALPPVIPTSNIQDSQSLDAAVLSYTSDKFAANIIYGKITETASDYDDDESLLGLDAKYNVSDALALQAYLFDYAYPALNNHLGIWGVKPTYKDDALNLAVEFAKNYTGNKAFASSNKGWMVKADAGIDVAFESMDITPRVSYIHSEKDFQANGNYMPGLLISYGLGQLFRGSGDVRIINGGLDIKFASLEKWNFALDYFGASNDYGTGMEWFGNEFDLMAKYALNEYVELHGALGILTNADETHPYTGQLGMIVRF
ncbi:MAG: hypothetical protein LBM71_04900 [Elusimicrobiota bacterium]|nr:hypothetical protein [Elusimicrobiota bacterium]